MSSPLETFAGLLDRSVLQIAALAADARTFDASRIGRIADIWDNNTFPLVSAACALRPLRATRARAGLRWMADLGPARRALMVELDPSLDEVLPGAAPEPFVSRGYEGRVFPLSFPVTAEVVAGLVADYDLACAGLRSLAVGPSETGPQVRLTLAAPRRFVPGTTRGAGDGPGTALPAALLNFTFIGVSDLRFDAADRVGLTVDLGDAGLTVAIGHGGSLRAARASVWPDDLWWHESAAGRAADAVTPRENQRRQRPVNTSFLTSRQQAAARALVELMVHVRVVSYHPELAARIPVREICRLAAGAGGAILAASAKRGAARGRAFAELVERWRRTPPDFAAAPIPSGPAVLRYVGYSESHDVYGVHREGAAILTAAVPDADPAAPWRLAGEKVMRPALFRISTTALDDVQAIHRDAGALAIGDVLAVRPQ